MHSLRTEIVHHFSRIFKVFRHGNLYPRAGFGKFNVTSHRLDYQYASFEEYWSAMEASDILKQQFDALPAGERNTVRDEIARFARDFHTDHGLVIPHEYLLAVGSK